MGAQTRALRVEHGRRTCRPLAARGRAGVPSPARRASRQGVVECVGASSHPRGRAAQRGWVRPRRRCSPGAIEAGRRAGEIVAHARPAVSDPCCSSSVRHRSAQAVEHRLSWFASPTASGLCARVPERAAHLRQQPAAAPHGPRHAHRRPAVGHGCGCGGGRRHVRTPTEPGSGERSSGDAGVGGTIITGTGEVAARRNETEPSRIDRSSP